MKYAVVVAKGVPIVHPLESFNHAALNLNKKGKSAIVDHFYGLLVISRGFR